MSLCSICFFAYCLLVLCFFAFWFDLCAMKILFEDYYLLVVEKPAGLSTENGGAKHTSAEQEALLYFTESLMSSSASKRLKATPFLRVAHRLDRPASGILVLAKTKTALTHLMAQFEQRTVQKTYLAATERAPALPSAELRHWLRKDEEGKKAQILEQQARGTQLGTLRYRTLERVGKTALLEVQPTTGRFHQIRAQLAHIGCPVIGDLAYGGHFWHLDQIKLHAHRLAFQHPKTGEPLVIESPKPSGW